MGDAALNRVLSTGVDRRSSRRRFRRSARFLRNGPSYARDPPLRRVHKRCAKIHVRGARSRAHQARCRNQIGPPCPSGQGGRHPYRSACRLGCSLRCGLPSCRPAPRPRPRGAVRRGRDARPATAVFRQTARHIDQWRWHRRACGRSPGRSRRRGRGAFARDPSATGCGVAADVVQRKPRRHHRRRGRGTLCCGPRRPSRRPAERRHSGDERPDRARVRRRYRNEGRRANARAARKYSEAKTGPRHVDRCR